MDKKSTATNEIVIKITADTSELTKILDETTAKIKEFLSLRDGLLEGSNIDLVKTS